MIASFGRRLNVRDDAGTIHACTARRRLESIVSGDRVLWEPAGEGAGVVVERLPRVSVLARPRAEKADRPIAANVDRILVVIAPVPSSSDLLVDRYLVVAEYLAIPPRIIFNKADLVDGDRRAAVRARLRRFESIGYETVWCSARSREGMEDLARALRDRASVLVGQSGVGKSSLTRALLPDQEIAVGRLARSGRRGRHTTSAATLYPLPGGGHVIDSPGIREFGLWQIPRRELAAGFREFRPYLDRCRFRDCQHRAEPGCAVLEAAARAHIDPDRVRSYHTLLEEAST